ncbi:hypothetical protein GCM10010517_24250 [Streptosporangium fragile]|uniref:Uncharacterized protein n=1 Tax=Streptosporangium fragile TaxID=46186 RepID=A0ABP6IE20_9ACTN
MCALIFEYGMATLSWYAEFAFRRRVSMSAIGSVIVMAGGLPHRGFPKGPAVRSWAPESAPGEYELLCRAGAARAHDHRGAARTATSSTW